jgi:hypothetical protein
MSKFSRQSLLLVTIAIVGFALSLMAFWPGFMEYDSFDQYGQAIGVQPLDDGHPIIMALFWRVLIALYNGPQPMLLLQSFLYWSGFLYLSLYLLRDTSRFKLALTAILVPFLPFLLNFSGVIWKDTQMALSLFWAILLLVFGKTSKNKLLISLLLILYATLVRHNGVAAVLPILLLWSYQYVRFRDIKNKYSVPLITIFLLFIFLLINPGLNRIFSVEKTDLIRSQHLSEIVFIHCHSAPQDFSMLKKYYGESLTQMKPQYRQKYLCDLVSSLASTDDTGKIYDQNILDDEPDSQDDQIPTLWIKSVESHPSLYLQYRLLVYMAFMRPFSYTEPYYVFVDGMDTNPLPIKLPFEVLNPFGLSKLLKHYVNFFATSKYLQLPFRPFLWLITLMVTTLLALHKRQRSVCLISASGLLYLILYFPVLPAPDFRYCYYALFAQILSIYIALDRRYRGLTSPHGFPSAGNATQ